MHRFALYYEREADYSVKIESIVALLKRVRDRWKVDYRLYEVDHLSPSDIERLKDDIRSVLPQVRGRIVSSQNRILPLSRRKNLNLKNVPILLLYEDDRPVNVFPHLLGTTYFDIEGSLEHFVKEDPRAHLAIQGLLENPIQKILADDPQIIEKGMRFLEADVETKKGTVDMVLQDSSNNIVVVEIETRANEAAVAQVCRLAVGYSLKARVNQDHVRRLIVCEQFSQKVADACRGANVELYKLNLKRII